MGRFRTWLFNKQANHLFKKYGNQLERAIIKMPEGYSLALIPPEGNSLTDMLSGPEEDLTSARIRAEIATKLANYSGGGEIRTHHFLSELARLVEFDPVGTQISFKPDGSVERKVL